MGFLDVLLGRTKPVAPNLDTLFAVPNAALTLEAAVGLSPSGAGAVCFKPSEGTAAQVTAGDIRGLLATDPDNEITVKPDEFGYLWVVCRQPAPDLPKLVTDLHGVNTVLVESGFGGALLCTVIGFTEPADGRGLALVYLYKRGTVYPFAPTGHHSRDTALEMQARAALAGELPIEPELERWFPLWDSPVPM